MANILVIGNGFDLAHGLPTRYSDFLDFVNAVKETHTESPVDTVDKDKYAKYLADIRKNDEKNDDELFDEYGELISDNRLLDYFLEIYQGRCREGKKGWIDFEREIADIVRDLDIAYEKCRQHYESEDMNHNGSPRVSERVSSLLLRGETVGQKRMEIFRRLYDGKADPVLDDLNRITRLLELYLVDYAGTRGAKQTSVSIFGKATHVLSFNYTDTYQRFYDAEGKAKYCYIHGKASRQGDVKRGNLVLGINEYQSPGERDSDNRFVWFKKFYQRIYKGTDSSYLDWIDDIEKMGHRSGLNPFDHELHIYGHSLDITDKDVLRRLILIPRTISVIYYCSSDDLADKIRNLVAILGEKKLIQRTGGENRSLIFEATSATGPSAYLAYRRKAEAREAALN